MVKRVREKLRLDPTSPLSSAQDKVTLLPDAIKLRTAPNDKDAWPIYQCENVFILPGIPELFREKFTVIVDHFLSGHPTASAKVKFTTYSKTFFLKIISVLYYLTAKFVYYVAGTGCR